MKLSVLLLGVAVLAGCQNTLNTPIQKEPMPVLSKALESVHPVVSISPRYPKQAFRKKLEGWVHVRFDVDTRGSVKSLKVVDSSPKGYGFEENALWAVKKWKYKPLKVNGKKVIRKGHEEIVQFEL